MVDRDQKAKEERILLDIVSERGVQRIILTIRREQP